MEKEIFNLDLCKRFVSDMNLPIPITDSRERFFYYIDLYQDKFSSRDKWDSLCNEITIDHNGDVNKFLEYFHHIRDKMINDVLDSDGYKDFITTVMNKYTVCDDLKNIQHGNVYNPENVGKNFLSIDLKSGNFQALKYFDKSIVLNEDTYDEYISRYTSSKYIQRSKYFRQVVFGKCNASRQITIEKHLMSEFYKNFKYREDWLNLVRFNNDELVFELTFNVENTHIRREINQIIKDTMDECGIDVSFKFYHLYAMYLQSKRTGKCRNLSYILTSSTHYGGLPIREMELKEVPSTFYAIVYKLIQGNKLCKDDYYFTYEGLSAYIDDDFESHICISPTQAKNYKNK